MAVVKSCQVLDNREVWQERGVVLVHTTILRWVQYYVLEFEECWSQYARPIGGSWGCDETYVKVKGKCTIADYSRFMQFSHLRNSALKPSCSKCLSFVS